MSIEKNNYVFHPPGTPLSRMDKIVEGNEEELKKEDMNEGSKPLDPEEFGSTESKKTTNRYEAVGRQSAYTALEKLGEDESEEELKEAA